MKLKKIAALALAGVMAVSMLAGCANKPADSKPTDEPTSGVTVAAINAALDESVTKMVTFNESTSLGNTVEKFVQYVGSKNVGTVNSSSVATLVKFDSKLSKATYFNNANQNGSASQLDEKDVKDATSITQMAVVTNVGDYTDKVVAQKLADAIETLPVQDKSLTLSGLAKTSTSYTDNDGNKYYYAFKYTGEMSVTKVVDGDTVSYVVALTVTRTPTKTAEVER